MSARPARTRETGHGRTGPNRSGALGAAQRANIKQERSEPGLANLVSSFVSSGGGGSSAVATCGGGGDGGDLGDLPYAYIELAARGVRIDVAPHRVPCRVRVRPINDNSRVRCPLSKCPSVHSPPAGHFDRTHAVGNADTKYQLTLNAVLRNTDIPYASAVTSAYNDWARGRIMADTLA